MQPVLLIHGGAASRKPRGAHARAIDESLAKILDEVFPRLERGASAVEAVTHAVRLLENDPLYNAGRGSLLQSDGKIRMSASLMDGGRSRFSGCINVEGVKNPILLARTLQTRKDRVLSTVGAAKLARELDLTFASNYTPLRVAEWKRKKAGKSGTVGAVALDKRGRLAAATSTGGRGFEYPYRVSDSPTVAGNYATRHGAVSCTGFGERIVDFAAAATLCAQVEAGKTIPAASKELMARVRRAQGGFGWIAVDAQGRVYADTATPHLVWAGRGNKTLR